VVAARAFLTTQDWAWLAEPGTAVRARHALRVSFITHFSLGGVPLAVAQKLARHSDPRLTSNVYTSLSLAELHKAVQALPATGAARADPKAAG
jgi:site-specific recombinase XerD